MKDFLILGSGASVVLIHCDITDAEGALVGGLKGGRRIEMLKCRVGRAHSGTVVNFQAFLLRGCTIAHTLFFHQLWHVAQRFFEQLRHTIDDCTINDCTYGVMVAGGKNAITLNHEHN